jgi:hypothetical protein
VSRVSSLRESLKPGIRRVTISTQSQRVQPRIVSRIGPAGRQARGSDAVEALQVDLVQIDPRPQVLTCGVPLPFERSVARPAARSVNTATAHSLVMSGSCKC